jgi:hypothetical protein
VPPKWNKEKTSISYKPVMFFFIDIYVIPFVMCRKRKPRKNTTKGWFPKEASSSTPEQPSTSTPEQPPYKPLDAPLPPYEDVGDFSPPSPPRHEKRAVLKKLTPKKKIGE